MKYNWYMQLIQFIIFKNIKQPSSQTQTNLILFTQSIKNSIQKVGKLIIFVIMHHYT